MSDEISTKVSSTVARHLQRFGIVFLGTYFGGVCGSILGVIPAGIRGIFQGDITDIIQFFTGIAGTAEFYTTTLFSDIGGHELFQLSFVIAVVIGMFAKRNRIGFVRSFLISGIIPLVMTFIMTFMFPNG